ncbi:putative alpha/Beta hydrolase [Lupinus albus]|uniref:Putative alpha/Beta hydrolase n=1 Tax=Lupinus albus TaxID=3870 RepID=A0A6A4NAP1_LUPAL|nr:putative alpha/Beta hydrolase [Lupinus albus]
MSSMIFPLVILTCDESYKMFMSFEGSRSIAPRTLEFGKTHVVRPKEKHEATIVWLHGLGDNGLRYQCHICLQHGYMCWVYLSVKSHIGYAGRDERVYK